MGVYIRTGTPEPTPTLYANYTFDDQNANQITDTSWNWRNLTWGTMPSYTLVSWTNYAGNYTNVSSGVAPSVSFATLGWDFTMLVWAKATSSSQSYVSCLYGGSSGNDHQYSLIWNYNSWQYEFYDSISIDYDRVYRSTIMSGVSLNTRHLIGYSHEGNSGNVWTIKTYADGNYVTSITGNASSVEKTLWLWSSNLGDRFKWQIWEYIVYEWILTDQAVLNYYNSTKSNYWL